jgi:hypothetical protein
MGTKVSASVSTEDIRRAYYETAGYSLWITEFEIDPLQLIVCDDSTGKYYRVGVNLDGDGFTFDDAVEVAVQYADVPAGAKVAARAALTWASRDVSRQGMPTAAPASPAPKVTPAQAAQRIHNAPVAGQANGPTNKEGPAMDPAKIREALGLTAEAPDTEVQAALAAAGLAPATAPGDPAPPTPSGDATADPALPPVVPQPVNASSGDAILLDPVQYNALRVSAARGEEAWRKMREAECGAVLDAAIKAGKFPPARREHYERLWASDPDGTKDMVEKLAANVIPVMTSGYPGVGDETEQEMAYAAMYPDAVKVGGGRG